VKPSTVSIPFVVAFLAAAGSTVLTAPEREQPMTLARIMQLKLEFSQGILKSIVTEDYASLERQARELGKLTETSAWGVLRTPEYARQSLEFLHAAESLAVAAKQHNLESTTFEYMGLTLKCVQCHRYMRQARAN